MLEQLNHFVEYIDIMAKKRYLACFLKSYEVEFIDEKDMTITEYAVDAVYLEKINLT